MLRVCFDYKIKNCQGFFDGQYNKLVFSKNYHQIGFL